MKHTNDCAARDFGFECDCEAREREEASTKIVVLTVVLRVPEDYRPGHSGHDWSFYGTDDYEVLSESWQWEDDRWWEKL